MKIHNYQDIEAKDAEEGALGLTVRWLITKEIGAENFVMRMFEMKVGGYSPFHSHPWEHEVFILEGEGFVIGEKGQEKFRAGDAIFIPHNEKHQFTNSGEQIVKFLCLVPYNHEYVQAHAEN